MSDEASKERRRRRERGELEKAERRRKKYSENNDNRFFNNFILYFTLIMGKARSEEANECEGRIAWAEEEKVPDIRWDVSENREKEREKLWCCESQRISFETLNDYFVHTFDAECDWMSREVGNLGSSWTFSLGLICKLCEGTVNHEMKVSSRRKS